MKRATQTHRPADPADYLVRNVSNDPAEQSSRYLHRKRPLSLRKQQSNELSLRFAAAHIVYHRGRIE